MRIRTRIAPSPTGYLHIGTIRTALYSFLFARRHGGDFLLRIEDTDQARSVEGGVENIIESLGWAGLLPDEGPYLAGGKVMERGGHGPYTQSLRLPLYKKYADELVATGKAYPCFCTSERLEEVRAAQTAMKTPPMYDRHCRTLAPAEAAARRAAGESHVIRLAVPSGREVAFEDLVRGSIAFQTDTVDDQVLLKSDGFPTYHLAVVVDDHLMEISHVIRGEEWITSTPKHLLLYEAFGWTAPRFAHLSLLLNADKSKLSKRQGDVAVLDYAKAGYLPEAVINFIALLGWNPSETQEIYSMAELVERFELEHVGKAGSVFNVEKLDWLNGHYLRALPQDEITTRLEPFLKAASVASSDFVNFNAALRAARERAVTLKDVAENLQAMKSLPEYLGTMLVWKKSTSEAAKKILGEIRGYLAEYSDEWSEAPVERILKEWIGGHGYQNGEVLWPLRVALSGAEKSPPPFTLLEVFGREESLRRIDQAIAKL